MIDVRSDHTPFKNSPPTSQWRRDEHVGGGGKREREGGAESPKREQMPQPTTTKKTSLLSFVPQLPLIMIDFTGMHAALCVLNSSINQLKD